MVEFFEKPSTIVWMLYLVIAEGLSCLPSYAPFCVLVSDENNAKNQPGYQACATMHEGVFRSVRFIWDRATPENINAFAAIAVAVFTYTLWRSTEKLWKVSLGQTEDTKTALQLARDDLAVARRNAETAERAAVANSRPWLKVDVDIGDQPLTISREGASVSVAISARNVGNAPALCVSPHAWMFAWNAAPNKDPFTMHERRCEEVRAAQSNWDYTLFPDESFPDTEKIGKWSMGVNLAKAEIQAAIESSNPEGVILLYVGGCIDYVVPSDPLTKHQTKFFYTIRQHGMSQINVDQGHINAGLLNLSKTIMGRSNSAD
jgi:hypothetical protein